ncbi:MAG TPA: BON domain-containing protein [Solirubrobacteraceae bacterium]|nr:BON domain-containing protein [Solirubrobacteraceae bacterium]
MSDHTLENAVMQALSENRRVHADEIAAQAIDGTVILRGTVGSLVQQVEAARTARRVLGVQGVEDQLRVRPMPNGRADADTEAAVLSALIDDDELHAADIDVEAKNGAVTLSGLVELPRARDRAERIALGVAGVTSVHNRLKVLVPVPASELRLPANP